MRVREPIQVYLSAEERAELDRVAREQGVSRSEALRRALLAHSGAAAPTLDLDRTGHITPASAPGGGPPPRKPVAPLDELLVELADDRSDR
jgi:hypothetical protein